MFFKTQTAFRKWLEKYHKTETELIVGYYRIGSGKASMTWSQSVDQALCFGWIDGVRKKIDEESYCNRFTPRRKNSTWSAINIKKVEELKKLGLMTPSGLEAFEKRTEAKSGIYLHENEAPELNPQYEREFKKNKQAWKYFNEQAPSYKKFVKYWIMTAKQEKTRIERLTRAIEISEQQKKL